VPIEAPLILRVDPQRPDPEPIRTAADSIRSGRIVVFPTRCLYGLGADAANEEAVNRIFHIKQRSPDKPLLILIPHRSWLGNLTEAVPAVAEKLMNAFWPGHITLIFKAGPGVLSCLMGGSGKIGVRLPGHPVARQLVQAVDRPITGTSANLSGSPGCRDIRDLPPALLRQVDLALDAGVLKGGQGSSVVDVSVTPPVILRAGILPAEEIRNVMDSSSPIRC
jgi:L-threonylcarbamoyladenylate synthase